MQCLLGDGGAACRHKPARTVAPVSFHAGLLFVGGRPVVHFVGGRRAVLPDYLPISVISPRRGADRMRLAASSQITSVAGALSASFIVRPSVGRRSVRPSVRPSVLFRPSVPSHPSVRLFVPSRPSVCRSVRPSVGPSVPSIRTCVPLFTHPSVPCVRPCDGPSVRPIHPSVRPSVRPIDHP